MKAFYTWIGAVKILTAKCPRCKRYSFVIDGKTACCNCKVKTELIKKKGRPKRICKTYHKRGSLPKHVKDQILEDQDNKCFWCGRNLKHTWYYDPKRRKICKLTVHFDHLIAWAYSGDDSKDNFVASCNLCNVLKSDKIFKTIEECQDFLKQQIFLRGIEYHDTSPEIDRNIEGKRYNQMGNK